MTSSEERVQVERELDELIAELGEPKPVTTSGPETAALEQLDGRQDLLNAADVEQLPGVGPAKLTTFVQQLAAESDVDVRTKRQAIQWGRQQMVDRVAVYRGLCLMFVRLCFNLPPVYPSAIIAWQSAKVRHRQSDPMQIPRGYAVFWRGGEFGHVALSLGDGRCLSNDTGTPGTINVARIGDISKAWGYTLLGWSEDLNGYTAPAVKPQRIPLTQKEWRIRHVRKALSRARTEGRTGDARRLRTWLDDLLRR